MFHYVCCENFKVKASIVLMVFHIPSVVTLYCHLYVFYRCTPYAYLLYGAFFSVQCVTQVSKQAFGCLLRRSIAVMFSADHHIIKLSFRQEKRYIMMGVLPYSDLSVYVSYWQIVKLWELLAPHPTSKSRDRDNVHIPGTLRLPS